MCWTSLKGVILDLTKFYIIVGGAPARDWWIPFVAL